MVPESAMLLSGAQHFVLAPAEDIHSIIFLIKVEYNPAEYNPVEHNGTINSTSNHKEQIIHCKESTAYVYIHCSSRWWGDAGSIKLEIHSVSIWPVFEVHACQEFNFFSPPKSANKRQQSNVCVFLGPGSKVVEWFWLPHWSVVGLNSRSYINLYMTHTNFCCQGHLVSVLFKNVPKQ